MCLAQLSFDSAVLKKRLRGWVLGDKKSSLPENPEAPHLQAPDARSLACGPCWIVTWIVTSAAELLWNRIRPDIGHAELVGCEEYIFEFGNVLF